MHLPNNRFIKAGSVIFALSGSFRLLLALYARLLVMFSFTDFLLDAGLRAISLKSAQRAVQRFVFFYGNA